MPKVRGAECDDSPSAATWPLFLVMTLWEGWIQISRLTGIAQRRLDSRIHSYFRGFCFAAASHGNKDESYGTEPKDPVHPIHKSECHLTSASFLCCNGFPHARLACAQERNNSTPVGDTDTHAANGPAAMGNSNPSHVTSKVQRNSNCCVGNVFSNTGPG